MEPAAQLLIPSQSVLHSHAAEQLIPPTQASSDEQSTLQGPEPQATPLLHAPSASQSMSQAVAFVQSTPAAQAFAPSQSTSQANPDGQTTPEAQAPSSLQSMKQVVPEQLSQGTGHSSTTHQPCEQTLPLSQSDPSMQANSSLRVSNEHAALSASSPTTAGLRTNLRVTPRRCLRPDSSARPLPAESPPVRGECPGCLSVRRR